MKANSPGTKRSPSSSEKILRVFVSCEKEKNSNANLDFSTCEANLAGNECWSSFSMIKNNKKSLVLVFGDVGSFQLTSCVDDLTGNEATVLIGNAGNEFHFAVLQRDDLTGNEFWAVSRFD